MSLKEQEAKVTLAEKKAAESWQVIWRPPQNPWKEYSASWNQRHDDRESSEAPWATFKQWQKSEWQKQQLGWRWSEWPPWSWVGEASGKWKRPYFGCVAAICRVMYCGIKVGIKFLYFGRNIAELLRSVAVIWYHSTAIHPGGIFRYITRHNAEDISPTYDALGILENSEKKWPAGKKIFPNISFPWKLPHYDFFGRHITAYCVL